MGKLVKDKVAPSSYGILDDIYIEERWILKSSKDKCILKMGVFEWNGKNHLRIFCPEVYGVWCQYSSEHKIGDESTYSFIASSVLYFKEACPEIFEGWKVE